MTLPDRLVPVACGGCAPPVYVEEPCCRVCGELHCSHPDPLYAGIVPPLVPCPARPSCAGTSGAVPPVAHRSTAPLSLTGEAA